MKMDLASVQTFLFLAVNCVQAFEISKAFLNWWENAVASIKQVGSQMHYLGCMPLQLSFQLGYSFSELYGNQSKQLYELSIVIKA